MDEEGKIISDSLNKSGEEQLAFLGLEPEQLGGRILELGSGKSEKLKDTRGLPENCEIISLSKNIFSGYQPFIAFLREKPTWDKKTVTADALALPFEDESFNYILSVDAIPLFLTSREKIEKAFKEVWRVLKPGGEVRFMPANQNDLIQAQELFSSLGGKSELQVMNPEVMKRYDNLSENSRRLVIKKPPFTP